MQGFFIKWIKEDKKHAKRKATFLVLTDQQSLRMMKYNITDYCSIVPMTF